MELCVRVIHSYVKTSAMEVQFVFICLQPYPSLDPADAVHVCLSPSLSTTPRMYWCGHETETSCHSHSQKTKNEEAELEMWDSGIGTVSALGVDEEEL